MAAQAGGGRSGAGQLYSPEPHAAFALCRRATQSSAAWQHPTADRSRILGGGSAPRQAHPTAAVTARWLEVRWYSSGSENGVEEEVASGFALELAASAGILGPWVESGEVMVVLQNDQCSADLNRLRADRTSKNGLRCGQLLWSRYLRGFVCKRYLSY
jgi:hypothetical protein